MSLSVFVRASTVRNLFSAFTCAKDLLREGDIEDAEEEARFLVSHIARVSPSRMLLHQELPFSNSQFSDLEEFLKRRLQREPLAYILGEWDFMGVTFTLTRDVLIPRPETEVLVEQVAKVFSSLCGRPLLFADVGTGSGCIALSLAQRFQETRSVATDISEKSLLVAMQNAKKLNLQDRVSFILADRLNGLKRCRFHAIVSNPPYVSSCDMNTLQREVQFEPRIALDGGSDGLGFISELLSAGREALAQKGFLACEIGDGQSHAVKQLCSSAGYEKVEFFKDLSGKERGFLAFV